ncbi:MAG: hypothetical protein CTY28_10100 [Hyphomicrobium sp.]|nr:MAG: hypothetical protein CTY28_10100 [Hyphomicrobium sp.]
MNWQGNWHSSPPQSQWEREIALRDRLKDLEHASEGNAENLEDQAVTIKDHGRRLTRVEAGVALILLILANSKAAALTPEAAHFVASILKAWTR